MNDIVKLHLRVLVLQFGRKAIVDALAAISDVLPAEVEAEISAQESKKRTKTLRRQKSAAEHISTLPIQSEEIRQLLVQIGQLYENKQLFPNLRDAEEFLRRNRGTAKKFKNRLEALGSVLKVMSEMPSRELQSLLAHFNASDGQSDYAILANQLMGKPR